MTARKAQRRRAKASAASETAAGGTAAMVLLTQAKHVIQAVVHAHDAGTLEGENYDVHWPLTLAVDLLEHANALLDARETAGAQR